MAILWDSVHFSLGNIPMIWRNLLSPSLGPKRNFQRKPLPCLHNEGCGSRSPPKRRHVYRTKRCHIPRNHHLIFTGQTSSFIKYSQIWHPSEKLLNFKGVEHRLKTNHGNSRQMTDEQTFVWILQTLSQNAQGKAETSTFLRMLQPTTAHSSVLVEQVNVASLSIPINLPQLPSADITEDTERYDKNLYILLLLLLLLSSSSSYPLCRVFILIFLRQTMSKGIQCCSYSVVTIHRVYIASFSVESIVLLH